jgi:predicted TIM-barrel fold metal-dependent hydrolase
MRAVLFALFVAGGSLLPQTEVQPPVPVADHHQHLISPELAEVFASTPPATTLTTKTAADLVVQLDAAGIRRAVVLSAAYVFEQPSRKVTGAADKVRRENDWVSGQVARYPDRLVGFCGLNPLKDDALDELARCARDPHLRRGLKLHFGNSVVDYHNPRHVAQVRRIFRAANEHGMAIVVHARASVTQQLPYGRDEAAVFLTEILPAAPDVVVQVAHLGGAGPWEDQGVQDAFDVYTDAVAKGDRRTRQLYFDVTTLGASASPETARRWAAMVRKIPPQRILFGSDASAPGTTAGAAWLALRQLLPLTDAEFRQIAANVPPYLR